MLKYRYICSVNQNSNMKISLLIFINLFLINLYGQDTAIINKSRRQSVKIITYPDIPQYITLNNKKEVDRMIYKPQYLGTGVLIDNKIVITCYHIIKNDDPHFRSDFYETYMYIECITENNDTLFLTSLDDFLYNPLKNHDIAVLEVDSSKADDFAYAEKKTIIDSTTQVRHFLNRIHRPDSIIYNELFKKNISFYPGEKVYYSGHPFGADYMYSATGMISGYDTSNILLQGPINEGSSGSGVYDEKGNLIGIIDFKRDCVSPDLDEYNKKISKYLKKNECNVYYEYSKNRKDSIIIAPLMFNKELLDVLTLESNSGFGGAVNLEYLKEQIKYIMKYINEHKY